MADVVEHVLAQLSTVCRRALQCCHRSSGAVAACRHALNGSGSPMTKFDLNSGVGSLPVSWCAPRNSTLSSGAGLLPISRCARRNGKSDTAGRRTQDRFAIPPCLARKWFVRGGIRRCVLVLARCPFRGVHHEMQPSYNLEATTTVLSRYFIASCSSRAGCLAAPSPPTSFTREHYLSDAVRGRACRCPSPGGFGSKCLP